MTATAIAGPAPRRPRVLRGFRLSLGFAVTYLSLIVLIPLAGLVVRAGSSEWTSFWRVVTSSRALASYRLSFGGSLAAAAVNVIFGTIVAWVLVRYRFPLRKVVDAAIDLPFALPTAVAGITLTTLYAPEGWLGRLLAPLGIQVAFTPLGVIAAMTFVGLPFVVRTVQPVLEDLDPELEEAAASLGARRWQTMLRVLWPELRPALATGFTLALARGLGEYGSVVFIAGNIQLKTEITPLLIVDRLEQFDYHGATALAVVMLAASFLLLLAVNLLQGWTQRRQPASGD